MIKLIPKLIKKALRNPKKYSPIFNAKMKMVMVPGQGTIPALRTIPMSVLFDFTEHPPQLHRGGCVEKEMILACF